MNKSNKIPIVKMVFSFIILFILIFPFYDLGFKFPTYLYNGNILIDLKYILAGILFIMTVGIDFFAKYRVRKNNGVTVRFVIQKFVSDKVLVNPVIIILACNGMISPIIAVIIVTTDIVVDAIKIAVGNNGTIIENIFMENTKMIVLMIGIILTLFYNMPFEIVNLNVSDFLLVIAAVLSVVSSVRYYTLAKKI